MTVRKRDAVRNNIFPRIKYFAQVGRVSMRIKTLLRRHGAGKKPRDEDPLCAQSCAAAEGNYIRRDA